MSFAATDVLRRNVPGFLFAALLALLSTALADRVFAHRVSPVLCAVILGMVWRNTIGIPRWSKDGLDWTMQRVLRTGIALIGLRLTLAGAGIIAAAAVPVVVACILVALVAGIGISKLMGVPRRLGTLLAVGTAVCGCTAVVALSPVIRARNVETAYAVTCVVLFGCIGMLFYPWLAASLFGASPVHAGIFLGTSIHDTSQVVGSALIYSQQHGAPDALSAASVTKMLRNLSIAILIPAAAWLMRGAEREAGDTEQAPPARAVPFFVIAFVLFVLLRTLGDSVFSGETWRAVLAASQTGAELLLVCGMAAVGLNVPFAQMWRIGWRPLASGMLIAVLVGACSLTITLLMQRFFA
jgi:uncharacterized integral membrane protein (TIGR00698 family)